MSATITLRRLGAPTAIINQHVWPLTVNATGAGGIDSKIFVYAVGKADDPTPGDRFECIASVPQLFEIPTAAPASVDPTAQIPYYRKSSLEFVCRSQEEADDLWTKVQEQVLDLVRNWNSRATLLESAAVLVSETGIASV